MEKINKNYGIFLDLKNSDLQSETVYKKLIEYIAEYHLLIIKNLDLTINQFLRFSKNLGEVIPHDILKYRHPKHEMLSYVTNVDKNGKLDEYGSKKRASDWHTDGSFRKIPL